MGSRNWIIWSVAALCMLLVLGAMGIVTQRFFDQKNQDVKLGTDAYRGERMRLAMWRLDTLATSIVGSEDARPAEALYTQDFREIIFGGARQSDVVPEIYNNPPEHSKLYWSVSLEERDQRAKSPQVFREEYLQQQNIDTSYNKLNRGKLDHLNDILQQKSEPQEGTNRVLSNLDVACVAAHDPQFIENAASSENQQQVQESEKLADYNLNALNAQAQSAWNSNQGLKYKNEPKVQKEIAKKSKSKRREAVQRLTGNYLKSGVAAPLQSDEVREPELAKVTPFKPVWLNEELVLVRRVQIAGKETMQGVWLNKEEITKQLLAEVVDLFPSATLLALRDDSAADARENAMLSLPFILVPMEDELYSTLPLSELFDGPIGLAWAGITFALIAAFFMLKAVLKMSERRAAFVSSVTHELRTPLTTFRLYSEMLSSGLVQEESVRQTYLETLRKESERLTHLVENVLSYSQIERGSARAKVETVTLAALVNRFSARLEARASEDGMRVQIDLADEAAEHTVSVDTTGVEQIIFNLVDNAAKYASGDNCGDLIQVQIERRNNDLRIAVCDQGAGVSASELKRLFKPFHKSAEQAASSKPGVGLGLALCRRLARAMSGDLVYQKAEKGACFVLKVPSKS